MSNITTHVLDTSKGRPAQGITAILEIKAGDTWQKLGQGVTNADGRIADLLPADHKFQSGIYRLTFETESYFAADKQAAFYPSVPIHFEIVDTKQHYHVPLLLNPFGYSTYRGS
jgi:5-hydroxyisourate hydrolase